MEIETVGNNDFKFKAWPEVVGVVVDRGNGRGFVRICGDMKSKESKTAAIYTNPAETGCVYTDVLKGQ